jgi:mannose-6-phosphate isomerase-like protein (cupin superfamily)
MASKIVLKDELAKLPLPATSKWPDGVWDTTSFRHGTMSLILFAPKVRDYQTPHEQDELYIVVKGDGELITPEGTLHFIAGDVLFVKAGDEHRFERFSDDLILWAVFWGEQGGEKSI